MAEGQTAYLGPAAEAKPYFTTINYPCPEDFNPADHFVYTLAVVPGQEEESTQRVNSICDEYSKSKFAQNVRSDIKEMETMADADDNRSKDVWDKTIIFLNNNVTTQLMVAAWL